MIKGRPEKKKKMNLGYREELGRVWAGHDACGERICFGSRELEYIVLRARIIINDIEQRMMII